jgi:hypothetical protein
MFFSGIKKTLILKSGKQAAVIYAYKEEGSKFVGLLDNTQLSTKSLAAKYGVPLSECIQYDLIENDCYTCKNDFKSTMAMQIPVLPFG